MSVKEEHTGVRHKQPSDDVQLHHAYYSRCREIEKCVNAKMKKKHRASRAEFPIELVGEPPPFELGPTNFSPIPPGLMAFQICWSQLTISDAVYAKIANC